MFCGVFPALEAAGLAQAVRIKQAATSAAQRTYFITIRDLLSRGIGRSHDRNGRPAPVAVAPLAAAPAQRVALLQERIVLVLAWS
jgi:hypothetical protein